MFENQLQKCLLVWIQAVELTTWNFGLEGKSGSFYELLLPRDGNEEVCSAS